MTFYVFSRILNLQIHAHIYRSFIRHHKMLGVRIAKRKIEPQKPANPCDTRLCSCIFSVNTRHVGASVISLAPTFLQKSERAHFAAPPLQIATACAGLRFGFGCRPGGMFSKLLFPKEGHDAVVTFFFVSPPKGRHSLFCNAAERGILRYQS